jgi:hypothetical protein
MTQMHIADSLQRNAPVVLKGVREGLKGARLRVVHASSLGVLDIFGEKHHDNITILC